MTRLVNNAGLIALFLAVTSISLIALAAYTQPNAKGGCIALAADAGTLIPRSLVGSTSVTIQDNDINPISFGYTAAQALTAGEVIAPATALGQSGGSAMIPLIYHGAGNGDVYVASPKGTLVDGGASICYSELRSQS